MTDQFQHGDDADDLALVIIRDVVSMFGKPDAKAMLAAVAPAFDGDPATPLYVMVALANRAAEAALIEARLRKITVEQVLDQWQQTTTLARHEADFTDEDHGPTTDQE